MKKIKKTIGIALTLFLISLIVSLITFTTAENECVIVTRFGKAVRIIEEPGLGMKLPGFFETVNRINLRTHIFVTQPIQLLLGDKNPIILTCYICWRISDPSLFFQSITMIDNAEQKLNDMINSQLGNVLGDYHLDEIINTDPVKAKLSEIEKRILNNANENIQTKYGLEILQVGIRRINYPSIVAQAVFDRMQSEREKEAKKYRAEGTEEAAKIEAQADKEVSEILAKAYREAEIIKGEGDREALRIYGEAYRKNPDFFEFLKSLELYQEVLKENSTLIFSTETDLFKYLTTPLQQGK
ncbi:MAG: protease modulator HflC [bacterium]